MRVSPQPTFDQFPSNRELLRRYVASRDEEAFAELTRRLGPMVLGVARRLLANLDDADDAVQLAFAELSRRAGTIENPEGLASWLHTVTAHIAMRLRRRTRSHEPLAADPVDPRPGLDDLARRNDFEILSEELDRLPSDWREPLLLRYFAGLSNEEAARQLGTSITAVEGRLKRGKKSLRVRLLRRGVSAAAIFAAVGPARFADAAGAAPLDPDLWSSVSEAAHDVAADPGNLSFLPPLESSTMVTPVLTLKAVLTTGTVAAVVMMFDGGHGSAVPSSEGPLSTIAIADGASDGPAMLALQAAEEPLPGFVATPADGTPQSSRAVPYQEDAASPAPDLQGSQSVEGDNEADPFEAGFDAGSGMGFSTRKRRPAAASKPAFADEAARNSIDARSVAAALTQPREMSLDFVDVPLSDAIDRISEQSGIAMWIDESALSDLGFTADEPITAKMDFQSADEALEFVLVNEVEDLDYVVRAGRVEITTADDAEGMTTTRRYDLPAGLDADVFLEGLTRHVIGSSRGDVSWEEMGGSGVASVITLGSRATLLVTQSDRGHEAVEQFLELLADPAQPITEIGYKNLNLVDDPAIVEASEQTPFDAKATPDGKELTVVAYDIAKISQLLFDPPAVARADENYAGPGGGFEDYGEAAGGDGFSGLSDRPLVGLPTPLLKLISFEELQRLSQQPIEAALAVQRGSQLLIRTDKKNHQLIQRAIEELETLLVEAGPPSVNGATSIEQPSRIPRGKISPSKPQTLKKPTPQPALNNGGNFF